VSARLLDRAQRALREGATARFVSRARLTLGRREDEGRVRFALEDALRTADFADCGRLIVVRALRLGRLGPRAGPAQFAAALEAAWRDTAPRAVPFTDSTAAQAPAVFFRSIHHARREWLARLAQDRPLDAWFWTRALPEVAFADSIPQAAAALVIAAVESSPEEFAALLDALPQAALQRLAGLLPAAHARLGETLALVVPPLAKRAPQALAALVAVWPTPAVRRLLLALSEDPRSLEPLLPELASAPQTVAAATRPAAGSASKATRTSRSAAAAVHRAAKRLRALDLPRGDARIRLAAALSLRHELGAAPALEDLAQALELAARAARPPMAEQPEEHRLAAAQSSPRLLADPALPSSDAGAPRQEETRARDVQRVQTAAWPWLQDNTPTQHGGLLMLLNALPVLRFDEWLQGEAQLVRRGFGRALLAAIADRLRMPPDDPQRALLELDGDESAALADPACARALRDWLRRLRRAMRLQAKIGIASTVLRRAGVSATPTHVDIVMPLEAADLRLRRAGLDADPGWAPWFGRIVSFHLVAGARSDG
jgi:hypothetical protein